MPRRHLRLLLALTVLLGLEASPAHAFVERTIQIDGDFSDWDPVLADPANQVADLTEAEGDPDFITNQKNDLTRFAVTWDEQNLYLYWRRVEASSNGDKIALLAYIDADHDVLLDVNDKVLIARFEAGPPRLDWVVLFRYLPVAPPDPMPGDGEPSIGDAAPALAAQVFAAVRDDANRFEARVDWATLGVTPRSALVLKGAIAPGQWLPTPESAGTNLDVPIVDNTALLDTALLDLSLTRDRDAAVASPGSVDLAHVVTTGGNTDQTVAITAQVIGGGAAIELHTDPNGDGDPADGSRMAVDVDGDGDHDDPGDSLQAWADSDSDGVADTGTLASATSFPLVVRLQVPAGATGGERTVLVTATSAAEPTLTASNTDRVRIGAITLLPPRSASIVPGNDVDLGHQLCNLSGASETIDVAASGSTWAAEVRWNDVPVTDLDLGADTCVSIVVRVSVPVGVAIGAKDLVLVTATARSDPSRNDSLLDEVTASLSLVLAPPRNGVAAPDTSVYYPHALINASASPASFDLTATSSLASGVIFWSDPDGDGDPADGAPITLTPLLAPAGGSYPLVAQVVIPPSAVLEAIDTTTLTATDRADASNATSVVDVTEVRLVATFAEAPPAIQVDTYPGCSTVHVVAGPVPADDGSSALFYQIRWLTPQGDPYRSGPLTAPDASGLIADQFTFAISDPPGTWQLQLWRFRQADTSWALVSPGGSHDFDLVDDLASVGSRFSLFGTDRTDYLLSDRLSLTAILDNATPFLLEASSTEYLLLKDVDGDGQPSSGDSYIDVNGIRRDWSGSGFTCRATGLPAIAPSGAHIEQTCADLDISFELAGRWLALGGWSTLCGNPVATTSSSFNVACTPTATAAAGSDTFLCSGESAALGTSPAPGVTYSWSPPDGLDDPTAARPQATPAVTTQYTLTATDAAGCASHDDVLVLAMQSPTVDPGPSPTICAGDSVVLGTPGDIDDQFSWQPSSYLDDPTLDQPTTTPPSSIAYQLTVTAPTGCVAADWVDVTVLPRPPAEAGPDRVAPATIGPGVCDPTLLYAWTPTAGLDDPSACNPTASPATDTSYCLTTTAGSSCESTPSCVLVTLDGCTVLPAEVAELRALRSGDDVALGWQQAADADGGYRAYRWADKHDLVTPPTAAQRVFETAASPTATAGTDPGAAVTSTPGELHLYRVVGVCSNGVSEGP